MASTTTSAAATTTTAAAATTTKRLLSDIVSHDKIQHLPPNYIRPISERPNLENIPHDSSVPVIDLAGLHGPDRPAIVRQIAAACGRYGFFQIKNHGVSKPTVSNTLDTVRQFFALPESERLKTYSDDPTKTPRLSTSFNPRAEKIANWRDVLRLHCHPVEDYVHEWPENPQGVGAHVAEYCRRTRELSISLIEAISEGLGLDRGYIGGQLGKHAQHMSLNYYPPCPQPDLTYGLTGHTDANLITVLLQDDVSGLQVLRDGEWVAVDPVPDTFIVIIGDQMQVLSNNQYKSVIHRAVVNYEKERISIPTFYCPSPDSVIGPAPQLVNDDRPHVYRRFTYAEYYDKYWNRGLATERCLEMFLAS